MHATMVTDLRCFEKLRSGVEDSCLNIVVFYFGFMHMPQGQNGSQLSKLSRQSDNTETIRVCP